MAMLPDAAATDAARTGENRAGVYTGVWTAGETLGLALGPAVFAVVLALGGYVSSHGRGRHPARVGPHRDHPRLLAAARRADPAQPALAAPLHPRCGRRRPRDHGGHDMNAADMTPSTGCAPCRRTTCPSTAAARSPTSTTAATPRWTGSAARRWRRTPAPTASTRPPSPACCGWRTSSSAFACGLLDAPDSAVGTVTSGRHRVDACWPCRARATPGPTWSGRPWCCPPPRTRRSTRPRTTSASRRCWCPSAPTSGPTPAAMAAAIDDRTVLVVASAPSYAHGVVDPVTEIAAAARAARRPLPRRRLHRRLGAAVRRPAGAAGARRGRSRSRA